MPTITRTQTLEPCPSCRLGNLVHILAEWEPFPEDSVKIVESRKCILCDYELVTKDELTGRRTPYIKTQ